MPVALSAQARQYGLMLRRPKPDKLANPFSRPAPLLQVTHPDPPSEPVIQLHRVGIPHADPEIVHPSPDIGLDMSIAVLHRDAPTAARESPEPVLERYDSLSGSSQLLSSERKAKEGAVLHPDDVALVRVHLHLEFPKVAGDTGHHPMSGPFRLHEYDTIIGIAGESVMPPLKLFVTIIEEDVTQKR